jgi:hypothetical protein
MLLGSRSPTTVPSSGEGTRWGMGRAGTSFPGLGFWPGSSCATNYLNPQLGGQAGIVSNPQMKQPFILNQIYSMIPSHEN